MYLVAKLHPKVAAYESAEYQGDYLSVKDQERVIRDFYEQERDVPLCKDHLGTDSTGFVRYDDRIGRVVDLFTNRDHELMVKCQLYPEHDAYNEVNQSIFNERKKWGVSVGLANLKDPHNGTVLEKNLVHVALTMDPAFGSQNSYLFDWGLFEDDVDRKIAQKYVGNGYASDVFRKKMTKAAATGEKKTTKLVCCNRSSMDSQANSVAVADAAVIPETGSNVADEGTMQVDEKVTESQTPPQSVQLDENFMNQLRNIQSRKERQRVMQKHLDTVKMGLERMDDVFQEEWFGNLKYIREENKEIEQHLANMEKGGTCSNDALTLVRSMLHDKDPASAVVRDRLIEFAGANSKLQIQNEQRVQALQKEKRRYEEENIDLKRRLEESDKRPKVASYSTPSASFVKQEQQQATSSMSNQNSGFGEQRKVLGETGVNEYLKKWLPQTNSPYYSNPSYRKQTDGQRAISNQLMLMQQNYTLSSNNNTY